MTLRILERQTRTAPLGLRFWDVAARAPVAGGLAVVAAPKDAPHARTSAHPNGSGVYVLHDAPGLRAVSHGAGDDAYWAAPPARRDFSLEVDDPSGRFHPMAMDARLPAKGFFVPACLAASPLQAAGYVPLFSTSARGAPPGSAAIYATLAADGRPASWAMVSVESMGETLGVGVADAEGRLALYFAFPVITPGAPASPSSPPASPLAPPPESPPAMPAVTATVSLAVRHDPALAGVARPGLCELFAQPVRALFTALSPAVPLGSLEIALGEPLTLGEPGARIVHVA